MKIMLANFFTTKSHENIALLEVIRAETATSEVKIFAFPSEANS
jgi:hypothetical protein